MFGGFAELISLGLLIPFISALVNPQAIYNSAFIQFLLKNRIISLHSPGQLIAPLLFVFIFAVIIATSIRTFNYFFSNKLSAKIGSELSCICYENLLSRQYIEHLNSNSGDFISAITSEIDITVLGIGYIFYMFAAVINIVFIVAGLFLINWRAALLTFGFTFISYILFAGSIKGRLSRNSIIIASANRDQLKSLQDGFGSIRDILLNGNQDFYVNSYKSSNVKMRQTIALSGFLSIAPRFFLEGISLIIISFTAYFLIESQVELDFIIASLGAIVLGSQKLLPAVQMIFLGWSQIRNSEESINNVSNISLKSNKNKVNHLVSSNIASSKQLNLENAIQIENVFFKFPKSSDYILRDINLTIPKGSHLGLIGKTGSGKSTLIDLIMGLLTPSKGCIYVDDLDINLSDDVLRQWKSQISHVPQSIFLNDSSIAENIAFGVTTNKIDLDRLKNACQVAQLQPFIDSLPNGYNTYVGQNGGLLSGGQRQRLGIARALYKDSKVLIFDEATSALDSLTEKLLIESISQISHSITIITIAHKLEALKHADMVYQLKNHSLTKVD